MKTLYDILGVSRSATTSEIKTAFRRLARERHPDANVDDPGAEDAFKELNRAYAILADKADRARYDNGEVDESGSRVTGRKPGKVNPFSDFLNRKKKRASKSKTIRINGADVSYSLRVSFIDAIRGTTKFVSMTNGKRLKVTVPSGTRHEQVLRLKGQGMAGVGGGTSGDALVEIQVENDKLYQVEGDNIRVDLPITLQEAVLGGRKEAETVDGTVKISVPENSSTGTTLRLRGKGLPRADGTRGDQLVRLMVMLPSKNDPALTKFVRTWKPVASNDRTRKSPIESK